MYIYSMYRCLTFSAVLSKLDDPVNASRLNSMYSRMSGLSVGGVLIGRCKSEEKRRGWVKA